jgi:hypothetical protein
MRPSAFAAAQVLRGFGRFGLLGVHERENVFAKGLGLGRLSRVSERGGVGE